MIDQAEFATTLTRIIRDLHALEEASGDYDSGWYAPRFTMQTNDYATFRALAEAIASPDNDLGLTVDESDPIFPVIASPLVRIASMAPNPDHREEEIRKLRAQLARLERTDA